jgi:hypothetical protein
LRRPEKQADVDRRTQLPAVTHLPSITPARRIGPVRRPNRVLLFIVHDRFVVHATLGRASIVTTGRYLHARPNEIFHVTAMRLIQALCQRCSQDIYAYGPPVPNVQRAPREQFLRN